MMVFEFADGIWHESLSQSPNLLKGFVISSRDFSCKSDMWSRKATLDAGDADADSMGREVFRSPIVDVRIPHQKTHQN